MPATILRPYQQAIYDEIPRRLTTSPSVLIQAPARSGKSKIISCTAERAMAAQRVVLVLTHRDKIKTQLVEHCAGIAIDAGTEHAFIQRGRCYVAMNQTLIKRPKILSQLLALGKQVVIIADEAHRGDFTKTFDALPQAYRIGFTATPAWRWAKHMSKYYSSLIHGPQPKELIQLGNITPIEYYEMRTDLTQLKKGSAGDFTEESQIQTFDTAALYDGLLDELGRFEFAKCCIFCASKRAADLLNEQLVQNGYRSVVYYSGLKTADYNMAQFQRFHTADIIVTVSALSEGWDYTKIDLNILWRATTSLPLFIQMAMRGATPDDEKQVTTILDFGGNNTRFGGRVDKMALTMDRDWNALWQPPPKIPKMGNGVAAIKNCPACDYILPALAKSCCNCGYIFPEAEVRLKEGELVKIEAEIAKVAKAVDDLKGRRISTLNPEELAMYAKERNKRPFASRVARAHEERMPGWLFRFAAAMGYSEGWLDYRLREIAEVAMFDPGKKTDYADVLIS